VEAQVILEAEAAYSPSSAGPDGGGIQPDRITQPVNNSSSNYLHQIAPVLVNAAPPSVASAGVSSSDSLLWTASMHLTDSAGVSYMFDLTGPASLSQYVPQPSDTLADWLTGSQLHAAALLSAAPRIPFHPDMNITLRVYYAGAPAHPSGCEVDGWQSDTSLPPGSCQLCDYTYTIQFNCSQRMQQFNDSEWQEARERVSSWGEAIQQANNTFIEAKKTQWEKEAAATASSSTASDNPHDNGASVEAKNASDALHLALHTVTVCMLAVLWTISLLQSF
jgi:hypothetical protein